MSIPPKVSIVLSTADCTCSSKRISVQIGSPFPPAASISSAAVKIVPGNFGWGSIVFAAITMFAPSLASLNPIALPIPRLAPVINTVLFFNELIIFPFITVSFGVWPNPA